MSEPAARVSSSRTVLPQMNETCWLSAVQDTASVFTPNQTMPPALGTHSAQVRVLQARLVPVARSNTSSFSAYPTISLRPAARRVPSGDRAMSWIPVPAGTSAASSAVRVIRVPARAAGSMRSRKKRWEGKGGTAGGCGPCADRTNVRSSAAPVTPGHDTYGLGGVILARTAPDWVDLSSAALYASEEESRSFATSDWGFGVVISAT